MKTYQEIKAQEWHEMLGSIGMDESIKALNACLSSDCSKCPYRSLDTNGNRKECAEKMMKDAAFIIGEYAFQSEAEAPNEEGMNITGAMIGNCPTCNSLLFKEYNKNHCGICGQAVKWDDQLEKHERAMYRQFHSQHAIKLETKGEINHVEAF